MDSTTVGVLCTAIAVVALTIGIVVDRWLLSRTSRKLLQDARDTARKVLLETEDEATRLRRERFDRLESELAARQEEEDRDVRERRRELRRKEDDVEEERSQLERRVRRFTDQERVLNETVAATEALRKKTDKITTTLDALRVQGRKLVRQTEETDAAVKLDAEEVRKLKVHLGVEREKLKRLVQERVGQLEAATGLTHEQALDELRQRLIDEARQLASMQVREVRAEAEMRANREARKVILNAIQRSASSHTIENSVSVVNIQSDEMKGRIIGREGRNIRAFEAATGVEVIVDDTPEAVILSAFNPIRREVARLALIQLIQDGRIHPARIEEVVEKTSSELDHEIVEVGERTVIDLNLQGVHEELVRLVGRMKYRTSYGQNLLAHSVEVAQIASRLAAEMKLDTTKARRAGLLHDIGKVSEENVDTPHALLGMEICGKYDEDAEVCNAVGAHHDEIGMTSLISPIVQAADSISGSRPGARREALDAYVQRLHKLEEVAASFEGVVRVFAIQAGREVRVMVDHSLISDEEADVLAMQISDKIQADLQYPGHIKVTVIREVRSVAFAR